MESWFERRVLSKHRVNPAMTVDANQFVLHIEYFKVIIIEIQVNSKVDVSMYNDINEIEKSTTSLKCCALSSFPSGTPLWSTDNERTAWPGPSHELKKGTKVTYCRPVTTTY
jgi:hypothetical protein